jgi:hypothetical protein
MKRFLFILLSVSLLSACNMEVEKDEEEETVDFYPEDVGTAKTFWMLNIKTNGYDQVTAVLLAEADDCIIYVEKKNGTLAVSEKIARGFATEYQLNIHSQITGAFGEIEHMTGKNKVTILLADIQDFYGIGGRKDFTLGFFNGEDMLSAPHSNMRDMLYVDTNPGLGSGLLQLYDCIAHELQHLINFSNTYLKNGGKNEDVWINEGLSTAAELIYGRNNDGAQYIAGIYNKDPYETIAYGNNFFVWNGSWENGWMTNKGEKIYDVMTNYATVYLFFQWLRIHANNDAAIYKDIINYGAAGITDYRAVVKAAGQRIPDLGLNSDTDWETLLRTWMAANLLQESAGVRGYKGRISEIAQGKASELTRHGFSNTSNSKWDYFYPGEGIFSTMSESPYTPPGGSGSNIRYVGIGSSGIDYAGGGGYTGEVLLTFNANSDNIIADAGGHLIPSTHESGYLAKQGLDSGLPLTLNRSVQGGADKSDFPVRYGRKGIDPRPVNPPPGWTGVSIGE